jgi:hypothetical protein
MKIIGNRQSAIGNRQSAIGNRQSAIGNRQSAIGNRQSAVRLCGAHGVSDGLVRDPDRLKRSVRIPASTPGSFFHSCIAFFIIEYYTMMLRLEAACLVVRVGTFGKSLISVL